MKNMNMDNGLAILGTVIVLVGVFFAAEDALAGSNGRDQEAHERLPARILNKDEAARQADQIDSQLVTLHFVKSGYDCSSEIGSLRPALVILDSDLPEVLEGHLVDAVKSDERIPNAVVFVACRDGDEAAVQEMRVRTIPAPFNAQGLEQLAVGVTRSAGLVPRDVA